MVRYAGVLFLTAMWCSGLCQEDKTFRVRAERHYIRIPQFRPTTQSPDTLNVLMLDRAPNTGDAFMLWDPDVVVTSLNWCTLREGLVANWNRTLFSFCERGNLPLILTITEIYLHGKMCKVSWPYRVYFSSNRGKPQQKIKVAPVKPSVLVSR